MSFLRNLINAINASQDGVQSDEGDFPPGLFQIFDVEPAPFYRVPKRPPTSELVAQSSRAWVPAGQAVKVAGRTISVGMAYVGTELDPIAGWDTVDPALIDSSLPVGSESQPNDMYSFSTSYSRFAPRFRAGYLDWLADGAQGDALSGFIALRLYGLERRMLFDAVHDKTARAELPQLADEARRLGYDYAQDYWLLTNVADLLVASYLLHGTPRLEEIEPVAIDNAWELPFATAVGLSVFATKRTPLPAEWAFSWICSDRDTHLRTPAIRCYEEFATLFHVRYRGLFGSGMVLNPPKPRLQLYYQPLSSTFGGSVNFGKQDLADLSRVRKPQKQLRQIVDDVTAELDDYSRTIGTAGDKYAPLALAVRPAAVGAIADFPSLAPLSAVLREGLGDRAMALVAVAPLLATVPSLSSPPTQKQCGSIGRLANRLGYGIQPDPASARKAFIDSERVAIHRWDAAMEPAADLSTQLAVLALCAVLTGVDGVLDPPAQSAMLNMVATEFPIAIQDTYRLAAYVLWLAERPISFAEAKRQWTQAPEASPDVVAGVLVAIASRDGDVSVREMQMLGRLYALLGRAPDQLHTDLHQRIAGRGAPSMAEEPAGKRAPSRNGAASDPDQSAVRLDPRAIAHVQRQTHEVQTVLGEIFSSADAELAPPPPSVSPPAIRAAAGDDPLDRLIAALVERPEISLAELTSLAGSLGLMTSGAIETLNQRADALGLEPLLDCDDERCDISAPSLKAMLSVG